MTVEKLEEAKELMKLIELRELQIKQLYEPDPMPVSINCQPNGQIIRGSEIPESISDYIISYLRAELSEDLEHLKKQFENL